MSTDPGLLPQLFAGWAVGKGALLAGALQKRSAWKKEWNGRFLIMTCEEVVWFRGGDTDRLSCASWHFYASNAGADRRCIRIHERLSFEVKNDVLIIQGKDKNSSVLIRAASPAELEAWYVALTSLQRGLLQDAETARRYVRDRASLLSTKAFHEHPHLGSRNHRERAIRKSFYTAERADRKTGIGAFIKGAVGGSSDDTVMLISLTTLPQAVAAWDASQSGAFADIVAALSDARHPGLLPPAHTEFVPASSKLATVRPLLHSGSVIDLVAKNHEVKQPYSIKYASLDNGEGSSANGSSGGGGHSSHEAESPNYTGNGASHHMPQPLSAAKLALFGRQILEAMRFLKSCGLPSSHVHPGNVLLRKVLPPKGHKSSEAGWQVQISEYELALLGAPTFAEQNGLAVPRLHAASTVPFSVSRDVVAFGHCLYFMTTTNQLTETQLSRAVGARVPGPGFPGPPAVWALLEKIFLPRKDVQKGPTLVELLAEPFFSVQLPPAVLATSHVQPISFDGPRASMLKASRKRYGGESITVQPMDGEGAAAAAAAAAASYAAAESGWTLGGQVTANPSDLTEHAMNPAPQAPPLIVVDDEPSAPVKRKSDGNGGKKASRTANYALGGENYEGGRDKLPIGVGLTEDGDGKFVIHHIAEESLARYAGVPINGNLIAVNGRKLQSGVSARLTVEEVARMIEGAPRPVVLRVQAPKQRKSVSSVSSSNGGGGGPTPTLSEESPTMSRGGTSTASSRPPVDVSDEVQQPVEVEVPKKYAAMFKAGVPPRGVRTSMTNDGYATDEAEAMMAVLERKKNEKPASPSLDAAIGGGEEDEWD